MIKRTKEHSRKISLALRNRKQSIEHIKNRIKSNTGKKRTNETKLKMSLAHKGINLGKKHTEETKKKIGDAHRGEKSWRWKGGITSINMTIRNFPEYKLWRIAVFERDKYTCI